MKTRILVIVLLIVSFGFSQACADLLVFKDDTTVSGTVLEFSDGKFKVKVKEETALYNAIDIKLIYFLSKEFREQFTCLPSTQEESGEEENLEESEEITEDTPSAKVQPLKKNPLLEQVDFFYGEGRDCYYNGDYKSAIELLGKAQKYLRKLIRETRDREIKEKYKARYQKIESFIKRVREKQKR